MPTDQTARAIVVGADAGHVRSVLGPTSWMVLEELLLRSTGSADELVACISVRALGTSLGLAKDTIVRAIRRLREAGLVSFAQRRTDAGAFDAASYSISLPEGVSLVEASDRRARPPAHIGLQVGAAAVVAALPAQLSLLAES